MHIHLGPPAVSPHGISTAVGFLLGARLLQADTRRRGMPDDDISAILTRTGIGAPVGARGVYVVNHWSSYEPPLEWFRVWEGGISSLGGITGALVAAAPGVRLHPDRPREATAGLSSPAAAHEPAEVAS